MVSKENFRDCSAKNCSTLEPRCFPFRHLKGFTYTQWMQVEVSAQVTGALAWPLIPTNSCCVSKFGQQCADFKYWQRPTQLKHLNSFNNSDSTRRFANCSPSTTSCSSHYLPRSFRRQGLSPWTQPCASFSAWWSCWRWPANLCGPWVMVLVVVLMMQL